MREIRLNEHERLDDLMRSGRQIIQNTQEFCFSLDAVLLAHFVKLKRSQRVAQGPASFRCSLRIWQPEWMLWN